MKESTEKHCRNCGKMYKSNDFNQRAPGSLCDECFNEFQKDQDITEAFGPDILGWKEDLIFFGIHGKDTSDD